MDRWRFIGEKLKDEGLAKEYDGRELDEVVVLEIWLKLTYHRDRE